MKGLCKRRRDTGVEVGPGNWVLRSQESMEGLLPGVPRRKGMGEDTERRQNVRLWWALCLTPGQVCHGHPAGQLVRWAAHEAQQISLLRPCRLNSCCGPGSL